ncbi:hypothetical protein K523DRAFT_275542 [Schizophyllum commune Tattone D]|nr:hypothetical protein K523DRAFT_275542 [Schizophyllum commune Tattone D]
MPRAAVAGFLVVSAVGLAAAQLTGDCTTAILNVANNPDASACLSVSSLVPMLSGDASIVTPISNWVDKICPAPACSNETIGSITANITHGCSTELNTFGISSDASSAISQVIQGVYPTLRELLCLSDGDTNCVSQTLNNFQDMFGPLTPNNIYKILTSDDLTVPSNITCTDCVKAFYSTLSPNIELVNEETAQAKCGNNFIDDSMPSGIKQTASTETASSPDGSNAALATMTSGALFGSLAASSSTFASTYALLG